MIRSLIRILRKDARVSRISQYFFPPDSKYSNLYAILAAHPEKEEAVLEEEIYGDGAYKAKFQKLKQRFLSRLYDATLAKLLVSTATKTDRMHLPFVLNKKILLAEALFRENCFTDCIDLLNAIIRQARKRHLVDPAFRAVSFLYHQSKLFLRLCSKKQKQIEKLYYQLKYQLLAEQDSSDCLKEIDSAHYLHFLPDPELARLALSKYESIKKRYSSLASMRYAVNLLKIDCLLLFYQHKYAELHHVATTGIQKVRKLGSSYEKDKHFFRLYCLRATQLTNKLSAANDVLQQVNYNQLTSHDTYAAYTALHFKLLLQEEKYDDAAALCLAVCQRIDEVEVLPVWRDVWYIHTAFVSLLVYSRRIKIDITPYRSRRFFNNISLLAKDKTRYNISVRFADMLINIQQERHKVFFKVEDNFRKYAMRYLCKMQHARSLAFLQHFLSFINHGVPYETARAAFATAVKHHPTREVAEIVPYEDLWDFFRS